MNMTICVGAEPVDPKWAVDRETIIANLEALRAKRYGKAWTRDQEFAYRDALRKLKAGEPV
jgi:hypothetical protein